MIIAYLYYDFLNLYGESGNVKMISRVLKDNKIKHEILYVSLNDKLDFKKYDLVYVGSGTEENILIALKHLSKYKNDIKEYINSKKIFLATGNSIDMFGECIDLVEALNIFDYKVNRGKRTMSEVYYDSKYGKLLGFINNNSYNSDTFTVFKHSNFYGTYILGPVLVRNPKFLKALVHLINPKIKIDLKLETKAYNEFISTWEVK